MLHQTTKNSPEDTLTLLSFKPNRLGHATFLNEEAKKIVIRNQISIELCLSSNLLYVPPRCHRSLVP
jgi:adenosine deaminase